MAIIKFTFRCHVTSLVMWPFNAPYSISYRRSIVTDSISSRFRYIGPQTYRGHVLKLWRSRAVISHVIIQFTIYHFLLVVLYNRASISNIFRDTYTSYILIYLDITFTCYGHVTLSSRHYVMSQQVIICSPHRLRVNNPIIFRTPPSIYPQQWSLISTYTIY